MACFASWRSYHKNVFIVYNMIRLFSQQLTYLLFSGMDVNVGIKGLTSLQPFIEKVVWAQTEYSILSALVYKMEHSDKVTKDFLKHGLKEYVFS